MFSYPYDKLVYYFINKETTTNFQNTKVARQAFNMTKILTYYQNNSRLTRLR